MDERRAAVRKRVLYGAVVGVQADGRSYDCVVKNWSDLGARIEFPQDAELAEEIDLLVTQTGLSYRARVMWRRDDAVGLAFTSAPAGAYVPVDALDDQIRDTREAVRLINKVVDGALLAAG